jgi:hypothetical protein
MPIDMKIHTVINKPKESRKKYDINEGHLAVLLDSVHRIRAKRQ